MCGHNACGKTFTLSVSTGVLLSHNEAYPVAAKDGSVRFCDAGPTSW